MDYVWGILGILGVIAIGLLLSNNRKKVQWRIILSGLAVQLLFAFIVLKWEYGREKLMQLSEGVQKLVGYANEGVVFVFGGLANADNVGFASTMGVVLLVIILVLSIIQLRFFRSDVEY